MKTNTLVAIKAIYDCDPARTRDDREMLLRVLGLAECQKVEKPFHLVCIKALRKLRNAPGNELKHSVLLKRMKMDAKNFAALIKKLEEQGDIETVTIQKPGWPMRSYRLTGLAKEPGGVKAGVC